MKARDNASEVQANERSWPEVVVRGTQLNGLQRLEAQVRELCWTLMTEISSEPMPAIHQLVIADYGLYGDAIREVLGGNAVSTHTESEHYVGLGRAIPHRDSAGVLSNTVVVRAAVIAAALGHDGVEPFMPQWLGRYLLGHELAHCVDHFVRPPAEQLALTDTGEFSITRVDRYYQGRIQEEIVACMLAASSLEEDDVTRLLQLDSDPLQTELEKILQRRRRHMLRIDSDLNKLAFHAAQGFWLVLMQYAKAVAHVVGSGKASRSVGVPNIIATRPEAMSILQELADHVGTWSGQYPAWPVEGWPELSVLWDRLARAFGCVFEETPHGSALWLKPLVLDP